jgi:hypothetical protein
LTAISPDKKGIVSNAFKCDDPYASESLRLFPQHQSARNIYWSVNEPKGVKDKKLEKEDIKTVHWLCADIDMRTLEERGGTSVEAELDHIANIIKLNWPKDLPLPTIIAFSGGGFQFFWAIEPYELNGDKERIRQIEAYGRWIMQLFISMGLKADPVWNVDRIMRSMWTENHPDADKITLKGRTRTVAQVLGDVPERFYSLDQFRQLFEVKQAAKVATDNALITQLVAGIDADNPVRTDNVDALPISDRLKLILIQGHDPDNPKPNDNSDSQWLMDAVCNLPREGIKPAITFGLITDERLGISRHVFKQKNPIGCALKHIKKGLEFAADPELAAMNDKHFVLRNYSGKCVVGEFMPDENSVLRLVLQDRGNFIAGYENETIAGPPKEEGGPPSVQPKARWWLRHKNRRQYESLMLDPSKPPEFNGNLNLWRGFSVEPAPGDWSLFKKHIVEGLANGEPKSAVYIMFWLAKLMQFPGRPIGTALAFKGRPGTGKTLLIDTLDLLFAGHSWVTSDPNEPTDRFNGHLLDTCFLGINEAQGLTDIRKINKLKTMVTDYKLQFETKNMPAVNGINCINMVLASNEKLAVQIAADDRRFAVFGVSRKHEKSRAHFGPIRQQILNPDAYGRPRPGPGLAAMLYDLQRIDVSGWNPEELPKTSARLEQITRSLVGLDRYFYHLLEGGEIFPPTCLRTRGFRAMRAVGTSELMADYTAKWRDQVDNRELKAMLRTLCGKDNECKHKDLQGMKLPPLITMRQHFNAYIEHDVFPETPKAEADWTGLGWGQPVPEGEQKANDNYPRQGRFGWGR